jgi:DNA (cytosine-5)-methyltransferase 1
MRVLDLFSGIGGFSLGLERAGMTTVAFCEIDPFCRKVLAKHWPGVPIYDDIRQLRAARGSADVVCGGFPCQPFSTASAGKRYGAEHDSFLWPEMLRIIQEVGPSWAILENVVGIESMALEQVVSDLEAIGHKVWTFEIPACAVGHAHKRARLWICAYANRDGESGGALNAEASWRAVARDDSASMGKAHGLSGRLDGHRMRALGNAVVPQIPELIGRAILQAEAA